MATTDGQKARVSFTFAFFFRSFCLYNGKKAQVFIQQRPHSFARSTFDILTSIRSDHKLGGDGGLELEAGGAVGLLHAGDAVLARVEDEHLGRLRELPDVPPFHLRKKGTKLSRCLMAERNVLKKDSP